MRFFRSAVVDPGAAAHDQHVDWVPGLQQLRCVDHAPELSGRPCRDEAIASELKHRGHHAPVDITAGATDQVDAGEGDVQPAGADAMGQSVAADAGRAELVEVNMTVLALGEPRDLPVAGAAGARRAVWRGDRQIARSDCLGG